VAADDEVVEHGDAEELSGRLQALLQGVVLGAGRGVAAGVVV
jgi:hypothetical protein